MRVVSPLVRGRRAARLRVLVALLLALVVGSTASACATGDDAVATGGTFDFVSPGGQTSIFYDPPADRGTIGNLTGENLMEEGQTLSLSDFDGQVVVVNLWGQWCGPCRGEVDDLETVYENTRDQGVAFLGINVKDYQRDKAQDFVTNNKVGFPSIYDPSMRSLTALGGNFPTSVIPSTLVLDRQHRVAAVFLTALLVDDLQPVVERIAAEQ
ncbi:TlpA disulfide reductase family protein [Rhodococcus sp. NPDC058505]|uniref:TlpA disulfide reductase family protein n=1 Tax=unclassified Rhodococcus (in: high G+C Gram-positive bacteria) TaxID=192944 RepID=UPI003649EA12